MTPPTDNTRPMIMGGLMMFFFFGLPGIVIVLALPDGRGGALAWSPIVFGIACALGAAYDKWIGVERDWVVVPYIFGVGALSLGGCTLLTGIMRGGVFEATDDAGAAVAEWVPWLVGSILTVVGSLLLSVPFLIRPSRPSPQPSAAERAARRRRPFGVQISEASPPIDLALSAAPRAAAECPFCLDQLEGPLETLACSGCGTEHHRACLAEAGRCAIGSCRRSFI